MLRPASLSLILLTALSCGSEDRYPSQASLSPAPASASVQTANLEAYPSYKSFLPKSQKRLFKCLAKRNRQRVAKPYESRVPIFVITCDRITVLIQSLLSYCAHLDSPIELIIHDNHTTYPPTLEFLDKLESAGVSVYRNTVDVVHDTALSNLSVTIGDWYQNNDSPYYVVTDPDIEIEEKSADILDVLAALLGQNSHMTSAGPMLRFDDLPDHYPLKQAAINEAIRVHGSSPLYGVSWKENRVIVRSGYIDTAFGMYRKSFQFHNYNPALLTDDPYTARHLDWYLDPSALTADQLFYINKNNPVGHWSSTWLKPKI